MRTTKLTTTILSALLLIAILAPSPFAQDTLLINYQGRLTDNNGDPITGIADLTFTIYDGVGVPKWTEDHLTVDVTDGLFNVILGSHTALPDTVFTGEDRYLGITVGGDPEIAPRTLFTTVPHAVVSRSLKGGQLETSNNAILLRNEAGDSAVVFSSEGSINDLTVYAGFPVDPITPAFMVTSDGAAETVTMQMGLPVDPCIVMSSDASEARVALGLYDPPDPRDYVVFNGDPSLGGEMRLYSHFFDPDMTYLKSTHDEISFCSEAFPDVPLLEMGANIGPGAHIRMAEPTDERTLVEINASPSTGGSIRMFNPQPEPPEDPIMELLGNSLTFMRDCPSRATSTMKYGACEWCVRDTAGETLMVAHENGFFFKGAPGKQDYDVSVTPDSFKLAGGYFTGKVGIGLSNPDENLVLGKNLGGHAGFRLSIGDDTPGVETGIVVGTDEDNRAWMLWNVSNNFLTIGTEQEAYGYGNTLTLDSGEVGIGTSDPSYKLDVNGDIQCVALHETSDSRLKSDVAQLEDALGALSRINGVSFEWNELAEAHGGTVGKRDVGVIAEEVESVLPELVHTDDDGYKSVSYTKLVPVLIEAVKELENKTERISQLESQMEMLVKRLEQLEQSADM